MAIITRKKRMMIAKRKEIELLVEILNWKMILMKKQKHRKGYMLHRLTFKMVLIKEFKNWTFEIDNLKIKRYVPNKCLKIVY